MRRWVVVGVLAAAAVMPGRAVAAECPNVLGKPGQFQVFAGGALTADSGGATFEGRVAGGNARVGGNTFGTNPPLTPDPDRADVVVGGDLNLGGGGSVPYGRVTYGGALTGSGSLTALGGLDPEPAPFKFPDELTALRERSTQWAGLTANGTIGGPGPYDVRFTGSDPNRNVFALTATELHNAGKITVDAPATSAVLINVSGSTFTSALSGIELVGVTPEHVLWNFSLATSVEQNSGLDFMGTVLAPNAAVSVSNGNIYGQVLGDRVTVGGYGLFYRPFTGCLPDDLAPATPTLTSTASGSVSSARRRVRTRALGQPLTDTARLRDGSAPTGLITFKLYGPDDGSCSRRPAFTTTSEVSGNQDYLSTPFTPVRAGTYRWRVTYSGDPNNTSVGPTGCSVTSEMVHVPKSTPSLSTRASGVARTITLRRAGRTVRRLRITRTLGVGIHDTATLSGATDPTGSVTFELYGPGDPTCSDAAFVSKDRPVASDGTATSETFTPAHAGVYRWKATYSGDSNNEGATAACGSPSETVTVSKDKPTLRTDASPSVEIGQPVSDTAYLTGGTAPTGTVTFKLYGPNDGDCSGTAVSTSGQVSGAKATSGPFTPQAPGIYRWVAEYSGDGDNLPAGPTPCADAAELVVVRTLPPVQPTLATTASTAATAGTQIRDVAHLTGGNAPTGAITFSIYGPDNANCGGAPAVVSTVDVADNGDYPSDPFTPTAAGTYRWVAEYQGDDKNLGVATTCGEASETVAVAKAAPEVTTEATQTAGLTGAIADAARLTGGSAPTGTVTFKAYGPNDASCTGTPAFEPPPVEPTDAGIYRSPRFTPAHAGTYRWVASYAGDANNTPFVSACGDANEASRITRAVTQVVSLASGATVRRLAGNPRAGAIGGTITARGNRTGPSYRAVGLPIHDTVQLTGGVQPSGSIRYSLYGPGDATCAQPPAFVTETAVTANGDHLSKSFVPTSPGTYRWVASYSGDADNAPSGPTRCGEDAETVVVVPPAQPVLSSSASGAVTLGGTVHDTAHLMKGANPTGTLAFRLYGPDDTDCSTDPVFTATVAVSGNDDYDSAAFTPTRAGTYRWRVTYPGDGRNASAGPTTCGETGETVNVRPRDVTPAQPALSVTAPSPTAARGTPIYGVAHLTGGSTPTGAISFALYGPDDSTCSRPPVFTAQVDASGADDYASPAYVVPLAGVYRWVATYSGDERNAPAGPTTCGDPAATVTVSADPSPNANTAGSLTVAGTKASPGRPSPPKRKARRPRPNFTG